jgi:biopolymer transport protein ExbD
MGAPSIRADINVTPLIDVMLVLLILFMVVAPISSRGLDAGLPDRGPINAGPQPMMVDVQPSAFVLGSSPIATSAELETRLREEMASRPDRDRVVVVKAAGTVSYERVIEALDAARGAGASRMGVSR